MGSCCQRTRFLSSLLKLSWISIIRRKYQKNDYALNNKMTHKYKGRVYFFFSSLPIFSTISITFLPYLFKIFNAIF